MLDLSDIGHWFGADLLLSPTGDLAAVTRADRSRQRVLRRLLTAEADYLAHPDYGAGLPQQIGTNLDLAKTTALIRGQMLLEASVMPAPPPAVTILPIAGGVKAGINYQVAPEKIPAILSFSVSE